MSVSTNSTITAVPSRLARKRNMDDSWVGAGVGRPAVRGPPDLGGAGAARRQLAGRMGAKKVVNG